MATITIPVQSAHHYFHIEHRCNELGLVREDAMRAGTSEFPPSVQVSSDTLTDDELHWELRDLIPAKD